MLSLNFPIRWNQLDVGIVFLSIVGIVLEELKSDMMPINPTIMRVMRVLRIARGLWFCSFFYFVSLSLPNHNCQLMLQIPIRFFCYLEATRPALSLSTAISVENAAFGGFLHRKDHVETHFIKNVFVSVLKLLKMAKGIRALLDTVMQALPQVGNLGLLFFLLFFIFAALGVEMFGRLGKLKKCYF